MEEKSFIDFFKKFWGFFAIGFGVVVALFLFFHFSKKNDDFTSLIKSMQDSHAEEVKKLYELREEEKKKLEDIQKKYDEKILALEEEYKKSKEIFEEKKKDKAEKIIKDFGDRPKDLADRLSQTTGFVVILPEE
jgi:hypothetical protein